MDEVLKIIKNDPWLEPYSDAIKGRHQHVIDKEKELIGKSDLTGIRRIKGGLSVNGRPMPLLFI